MAAAIVAQPDQRRADKAARYVAEGRVVLVYVTRRDGLINRAGCSVRGSGGNYYAVVLDRDARTATCECPDYTYRGSQCCHIAAANASLEAV